MHFLILGYRVIGVMGLWGYEVMRLWGYEVMWLYIDGEILHRNLRRWWILLRAHCVNDKLGGVKSA